VSPLTGPARLTLIFTEIANLWVFFIRLRCKRLWNDQFDDHFNGQMISRLKSLCTANEGPERIQYKCLVPIYVFSEIKLCSLVIYKTEL
jgi:hypothetical protein